MVNEVEGEVVFCFFHQLEWEEYTQTGLMVAKQNEWTHFMYACVLN